MIVQESIRTTVSDRKHIQELLNLGTLSNNDADESSENICPQIRSHSVVSSVLSDNNSPFTILNSGWSSWSTEILNHSALTERPNGKSFLSTLSKNSKIDISRGRKLLAKILEQNCDKNDTALSLKLLRLSKGMNQKELAEKAGLDQSYISRLESGLENNQTSFQFENIYKIYLALGASPEEMGKALFK